jgi:hypothetical protein
MLKRIITILASATCLGLTGLSVQAAPPSIFSTSANTTPGTLNAPLTDADGNALPSGNRMIAIPVRAKRADMVFDGTTTVKVNGQLMDLAPAARIYGPDNLLKLSGALVGTAKTNYLIEPQTGFLQQIWILTIPEINTPDPVVTEDGATTSSTTSQ